MKSEKASGCPLPHARVDNLITNAMAGAIRDTGFQPVGVILLPLSASMLLPAAPPARGGRRVDHPLGHRRF